MKKVILSLVIVAAATFSANAQDKDAQTMKDLTFSVGVDAGIPTTSGVKGFYIGGDVQGEYAASPELGITLSAGYTSFMAKGGGSSSSIPVLGGIRYYFSDRKVYASAQAGVTIFTGGGSSTSVFTYAPGIGYYVSPNFDLLLKYQAASKDGVTSSQLALRAAYNF
ncbi:MAG: outer membrane beta-barrel protein [Bacteroidota bacterium]